MKLTQRWIPKDPEEVLSFDDVNAVVYLTKGNCALAYAGKAMKPAFNIRFLGGAEHRQRHIDEWVNSLRDQKARKEASAKAKAKLSKQPIPYKVGDIFIHSWGWEQTNLNFYQVVEAKGRKLTFREVAQKTVEETGWMQGKSVAIKDSFLPGKEPFSKIVQASAYDGKAWHHISVEYGCMDLWDGEPHFWSSYA